MIDPLAALPGYLLRRAAAAMFGILTKRLEAIGLTPVEGSILIVINLNQGITQIELCRLLDIKKANMTPRIAKLDAQGLISRRPIDGRSSGLFLTELGTQRQLNAWQIMQDHEKQILARIGPARAKHFVPALEILWDRGNSSS